MKVFFVATLALTSTAAMACPNLSGHFQCKDFDNGAVQDVTTTQDVDASGVVSYHMTIVANNETKTFNYVANGQAITVANPKYTTMTEKSTCDGNNLKTEINAVVKDSNEALAAIAITTVNAEGDMYDSYIGSQGAKAIKFEEVCKRVP